MEHVIEIETKSLKPNKALLKFEEVLKIAKAGDTIFLKGNVWYRYGTIRKKFLGSVNSKYFDSYGALMGSGFTFRGRSLRAGVKITLCGLRKAKKETLHVAIWTMGKRTIISSIRTLSDVVGGTLKDPITRPKYRAGIIQISHVASSCRKFSEVSLTMKDNKFYRGGGLLNAINEKKIIKNNKKKVKIEFKDEDVIVRISAVAQAEGSMKDPNVPLKEYYNVTIVNIRTLRRVSHKAWMKNKKLHYLKKRTIRTHYGQIHSENKKDHHEAPLDVVNEKEAVDGLTVLQHLTDTKKG